MAHLMLVNPAKRKRRRKSSHRRRRRSVVAVNPSPRRRSGRRRKMSAKQMLYFGGGRKRRKHHRRRSAVVATHRRRGRGRKRSGGFMRRFARSTSGRVSLQPMTLLKDTLMPAAIGGASALLVDIAWGFIPLPANIKTGAFAPVVKIAAAVGIGWLAQKFAPKLGKGIVTGYVTVLAYNFAKAQLQKMVPSLPLSEYGAYVNGLGYVQAGPFVPDNGSMSGYISSANNSYAPYEAGDADMVF